MMPSQWTEEDQENWHKICITHPDNLSPEQKELGQQLAERAFKLMVESGAIPANLGSE